MIWTFSEVLGFLSFSKTVVRADPCDVGYSHSVLVVAVYS